MTLTLQQHPTSTLLLNNLAVAYRLNGQHELAVESYTKLLQSTPDDDAAWFFLGCSYMALRQNPEAEDAFLRSSAITSDWSATWFNLGMVCERQKKMSAALLHFSRAIKLDPTDKDCWTRFRSLMDSDGPQMPYVRVWLEAPEDHDLEAYRKRAKQKTREVAETLFPRLRDKADPMWDTIERSYETIKGNNPQFAESPTILLFCAIVAGEKLGIPPNYPELADTGDGQLDISNGTGKDALVKIVSLSSGQLWRVILVKHGDTGTLSTVPDGHFLVFFALDASIDASMKLSKDARASRFEKALAFTTGSRLDGNYVKTTTTQYSLTLHPVIGGNAKTKDVTIDEFEKY